MSLSRDSESLYFRRCSIVYLYTLTAMLADLSDLITLFGPSRIDAESFMLSEDNIDL